MHPPRSPLALAAALTILLLLPSLVATLPLPFGALITSARRPAPAGAATSAVHQTDVAPPTNHLGATQQRQGHARGLKAGTGGTYSPFHDWGGSAQNAANLLANDSRITVTSTFAGGDYQLGTVTLTPGQHALAAWGTNWVAMSTGNISVGVDNYNNAADTTTAVGTVSGSATDADLVAMSSEASFDPAIFTLTISVSSALTTPANMSFDFVFASEEYTEYSGTIYNDVFGFWVCETASCTATKKQVALVGAANAPISINTIDYVNNSAFFVNNDCTCSAGCPTPVLPTPCPYATEWDGFTVLLTSSPYLVAGGKTYTLKMGIRDSADNTYDSMVYLQGGSLQLNVDPNLVISSYTSAPPPGAPPSCSLPLSFNASASYDPNGDVVSHAWLVTASNSAITATSNATVYNVTIPLAGVTGPTTYTVTLKITDTRGGTNSTSFGTW